MTSNGISSPLATRANAVGKSRQGALVMSCRLPDFETEPDRGSSVSPEATVVKRVVPEHYFDREPVSSERNDHRGGLKAAAGLILNSSCKDAEGRAIEFSLQHCDSPVGPNGV